MSGSFSIDGGQIVITNEDRTVSTTDGTLICLLPEIHTLSHTLVFPDFEKDSAYSWYWESDYSVLPEPGVYGWYETCQITFTAVPQEYEQGEVLMAAPDGADFILARVRINRTVAPTNTWTNVEMLPLPIENEWIPMNGSVLMEAREAVSRVMHITLEDGNLLITAQQSVGGPAGGFGPYGEEYPPPEDFSEYVGGEHFYTTSKGWPTWNPTLAAQPNSRKSRIGTTGSISPIRPWQLMPTSSQRCLATDTSDYTSEYEIDIEVQFGRRS